MVRQPQVARPAPAERGLDLLLRPPVPAGLALDVADGGPLQRRQVVVVRREAVWHVERGLEVGEVDHFRFLRRLGFGVSSALSSDGPAIALFSGGVSAAFCSAAFSASRFASRYLMISHGLCGAGSPGPAVVITSPAVLAVLAVLEDRRPAERGRALEPEGEPLFGPDRPQIPLEVVVDVADREPDVVAIVDRRASEPVGDDHA